MGRHANDRLQGTLDLLVLQSLARLGRMHGFGITQYIQAVSEDALRVEEGSLYPALRRMEEDGWIRADWDVTENNRRARYYCLTPAGQHQLAREQKYWADLSTAVARFLEYA